MTRVESEGDPRRDLRRMPRRSPSCLPLHEPDACIRCESTRAISTCQPRRGRAGSLILLNTLRMGRRYAESERILIQDYTLHHLTNRHKGM
jgi:hypothetical protein